MTPYVFLSNLTTIWHSTEVKLNTKFNQAQSEYKPLLTFRIRAIVMGGYSHLVPAGTFRISFLVGFVCPCIMLCLWRMLHRLAARRLRSTCRVAVLDPETSRDHLLDRTIEFAPIFCARSRFLYKSFSTRECRRGKSFSSELCSSTSEFEQSSRLLCLRSRDDLSSKGRPTELRAVCCATVVRWSTRGDVTTSPAT